MSAAGIQAEKAPLLPSSSPRKATSATGRSLASDHLAVHVADLQGGNSKSCCWGVLRAVRVFQLRAASHCNIS